MGILDTLARLTVPEPVETRSSPWTEFPPLGYQLQALRGGLNPWRTVSIKEALGVPSIFRAVTLISNTVGSLSQEAFRQGVRLSFEETPRIVIRPNPFSTPREFYRDTAYSMASRGEAGWWISKRDIDGVPISLYPIPPQELVIEENQRDRLRPIIRWRDEIIPNDDFVHIVLTKEPGALRGAGPLQVCGAAVSVSVEAQEWAANFFERGTPSAVIKSALTLSPEEAADLKQQWAETPDNMPRVIDPGIESVERFDINPESAQLTEQRMHQDGEAARMFGIPGSLLEYARPGSSLTYQNVNEVWVQFVRSTLAPNYLEPIEQAMSDLLTRQTVARFNLDGLLRADVKTRAEVYEKLVPIGVMTTEEARQSEGLDPGNVETAPVPLSPPQAVPASLPYEVRTAADVRCFHCGKLWAKSATPPYEFICSRCKTVNVETRTVGAPTPEQFVDGMVLAIRALAPTPIVNIEQPEPAQITVEAPPAPEVTVHTDSFVEAVRDLKAALAAPKVKRVIRDENGKIIGVEEVAA